ncbi:unnamed protein product [Cuscuta europaea]|uniref:RING-type E3 ubiquitin transferase n=1 Tax=Cuscuta europaea TaxID=41803 RepID=A0A9P1ELT6_CUSEU|nr:unnamed protein product [Cuscuta europaea]
MGKRNTPRSSHVIDYEADQMGQSYINSTDPFVFYGNNVPTNPQSNGHTIAPLSGNTYLCPLQDQPANASFYGMTHYNGTIRHQNPFTNHYNNPYMAAASSTREFPITIPYGRTVPYVDGVRGSFKSKNADGFPMNYHLHHAMVGSTSSVEASPIPPELSPLAEVVLQCGQQEAVAAGHNNNNHFIQGNFVGQGFQLPAHSWLDMQQINTNQAAPLHYLHGSVEGCMDGNMGIQGYQVVTNNVSLTSCICPHIPQGFSSVHHLPPPAQAFRDHNVNFPPQMAASSNRLLANFPSSPSLGVVEAGPTYIGPFPPPTSFTSYTPQQRDFMSEPNITRNRSVPHMRLLPEDGVAILEIPDYEVVGSSVDQHREMRMDIDHMSYEELLALGEQIGCVTTGLSEEYIISLLKTRFFTSSGSSLSNSYFAECWNQETNFCVICQHEYKEQENVGIIRCGHEYHVDCIKKWLVVKNSCPICKSTALSTAKPNL